MTKDFWTVSEIIEEFQIDEKVLAELEQEEILCPVCEGGGTAKGFRASDLESLRLIKVIMDDMGVNLPGVEVVLRMRQNMIEMRRQFDAILEEIAHHIREISR